MMLMKTNTRKALGTGRWDGADHFNGDWRADGENETRDFTNVNGTYCE
jgi:hypothetical protein